MEQNTLRNFQGYRGPEYHLPVILVPPIKIQNGHINVKSKKKKQFSLKVIYFSKQITLCDVFRLFEKLNQILYAFSRDNFSTFFVFNMIYDEILCLIFAKKRKKKTPPLQGRLSPIVPQKQ